MLFQTIDFNSDLLENAGITADSAAMLPDQLFSYLLNFDNCFSNKAQIEHLDMYVKGLLSDLPRKNIEAIALRYGDESTVRGLSQIINLFLSGEIFFFFHLTRFKHIV
jgi:hypothetical protein